jgi:hypothetical protein
MTSTTPIFVTARFRTGSTMLWHLLRQLDGVTAYYEPCHDNLLEHVRGDTPVQESHYAVDSYWDEYRELMDRLPPRDQWRSMTRGMADDRAADPDENTNYDLVLWAVALSEVFPFLVGPHIRHSYERHYLIWKLSYLMGVRCSTVSLSYDDDFQRDPARDGWNPA